MGQYHFRNLKAWQKAQSLTAELVRLVDKLPRTWAAEIFAKQVLSSAGSISANIAEGHARFALRQYRYHLGVARGSAAETDSWIFQIQAAGYISAVEAERLAAGCEEIIRMLTTMMLNLDREIEHQQAGPKRVREPRAAYLVHEFPGFNIEEGL